MGEWEVFVIGNMSTGKIYTPDGAYKEPVYYRANHKGPSQCHNLRSSAYTLIMESPGPFTKTRQDVEAFKREVYL